MDLTTIVSQRIKNRREQLHLSQDALSDLMGYTGKSTICRIENGDNDARLSKVEEFAKVLQTSPAYLMGWVDDPELTHEQTIELGYQGKLKPQILAADTVSADDSPILIHAEQIDKTQQHRNTLAEKIRNSDYTDEQLDKIEKMIDLML